MNILQKKILGVSFLTSFNLFASNINIDDFLITPVVNGKNGTVRGEYISPFDAALDFQKGINFSQYAMSIEYFYNNDLNLLMTFDGGKGGSSFSFNSNLFSSRVGFWGVSKRYKVKDCLNKGYKVLKIPSGIKYEGHYICADDQQGETPKDEDAILTPEKFDDVFCNSLKGTVAYTYYTLDKIKPYSTRIDKSSYEVMDGTFDIVSCSDDNGNSIPCTKEKYLKHIRKYVKGIPEERINLQIDPNGGFFNWSIYAYCSYNPIKKSPSDVTPDKNDCRKVIYQNTGVGGFNMEEFPEDYCFMPDDIDQTFKSWCKVNFGEDFYSTDGTNEICNPPKEKIKTIETDKEKKDIYEDKEFKTTDTSSKVEVSNNETVKTENKESGKTTETNTKTTTVENKKTVINNYGKDKGSSSQSEAISSYGDTKSWWTKQYPDGISPILDKHMNTLNNGDFGNFMKGLNPFYNANDAHFPAISFDFNFGFIDFGSYSIDLENLEIGNKNINLISLVKIFLMLSVSIYAFKQIL